jgi:DNA-binding NtrC family response regulator
VKVDFRLISASNRDLLQLVRAGKFREDLFYRLHIFPITVPPLRDRIEDLPDLVRRFTARFAAEEGKRVRSVSAEAMGMLAAYRWPGNVRQLENAVFRAVVLADGDEIGIAEFPQIAAQVPGFEAYAVPAAPLAQLPEQDSQALVLIEDAPATVPGTGMGSGDALPLLGADGHVRPLEAMEAETIRFAIDRYRGRMTEVARRLRIGRSTLYRKLKELGYDTSSESTEMSEQSSTADVASE